MTPPPVAQELSISRHERQAKLACRCNQQPVRGIAMQTSRQPRGLDQNTSTQWKKLEPSRAGGVVDKGIDCYAQIQAASRDKASNLQY